MTREQVTSLAAACMAAIAAIASFYLAPIIERSEAQSVIKLVAVLFGTVGFYVVFSITTRLLSMYRYRHVLGSWYYVTTSFEDVEFKDANFAKMKFVLSGGGELDYTVDLYASKEELYAGDGAEIRGRAYSDAIRYDASKNTLNILYHVRYSESASQNPDRYGRLFLNRTDAGTLEGMWVSDLHRKEISSGKMYAARPKTFRKRFKDEGALKTSQEDH